MTSPSAVRLLRRHSRTRVALVVVCAFFALWTAGSDATVAQDRAAPRQSYYFVFSPYYAGELNDALKEFKNEGRGAIKTAQSHWIDSICYHTMTGECYYKMGRPDQALVHYNSALRLYVTFPEWMIRVRFAPTIRARNLGQARRVPWGQSRRATTVGVFPERVLAAQGRINNNAQLRQGGVVQPPVLYPLRPQEIVRCTALAIRRRAELMGPVTPYDQLTDELIVALAARPAARNHWSEAWIDVQLGLAYLAAGKIPQAKAHLQRSLVAGGQFDHPLTSTALLELGKIALKEEDYARALDFLAEATYAAYQSDDPGMPDILEEAFHHGLVAHMMTNEKVVYPLLEPASNWARRERLRHLQVSLLLDAAENLTALGQTRQASDVLKRARTQIGRRDMGNAVIGARLNMLAALVDYQSGRIGDGDEKLAATMKFQHTASKWVFQVGLADRLFGEGQLSARQAMELYTTVLRDPSAHDWTFEPLESLSVLVVPHELAYEHWFEVALDRKEHERALEISDLAKRHRFYSSLGLGGRLLSLRWVLEAPEGGLPPEGMLERQKLLARFPRYEQLSQQARQIRTQLRAGPVVAGEAQDQAAKAQAALLAQLGEISLTQEALLREMAVRREPASLVFPPKRTVKQLRAAMGPRRAMVVFYVTSRHVYAFLLDNRQYASWQVSAPVALHRAVAKLLRGLGNVEANRPLKVDDLKNGDWRKPAASFLAGLFGGSSASPPNPAEIDEIIIVPDRSLWYVPFEVLPASEEDNAPPLVAKFRLRYAPMASLAVPDKRPRRPSTRTALVAGRMYPGQDYEVAASAASALAEVLPGAVSLPKPMPAPSSIYGTLFDRLVVLDEIIPERGPYDWSPSRLDKDSPGSTLDAWLALPWQGPDQVVLPGFHTAAENSLKDQRPEAAGTELFLSVCGMMATGTRTMLISRWRTGGQSSFDLVREFAQELPYTEASDAWQRSVLLAAASRIDPEREPRVLRTVNEEPPKAAHPFFWSGYLLVDSGAAPVGEEDPAEPAAEDAVGAAQ